MIDSNEQLVALAEAVYSEAYGHIDSKRFRAIRIQFIYEWLAEADHIPGNALNRVPELASEFLGDEIGAAEIDRDSHGLECYIPDDLEDLE